MSIELSPVSSDVNFEKDGKQCGYLRVPYSTNNSAWGSILIPIIVFKNGQGPTVLFTGGCHGGEYEGPVSLLKLSRSLTAAEVRGRLILIPALNLPAVLAGQRLSPLDGKDMNRVFPGAWNGTITQVIADYIYGAILPLCDAVIDLHSGGYSLDLVPYISMHYLDDRQQAARTLAALKAFQAPVSLIIHEISGAGLLDYAVEGMGKVFLCAELGGAGRLSPQVMKIAERGIQNLLKHFGLVDGQPISLEAEGRPPARLMEVPGPANYLTAMAAGIYESILELSEPVQAGQALGQIHFVQHPAREPEQIVARCTGMLLCTRGPGQVEVGDCVAVVAQDMADLGL